MEKITVENQLTEKELNDLHQSFFNIQQEVIASLKILSLTKATINPKIHKLYEIVESSLKLMADLLFIKENHLEYFDILNQIDSTQDLSFLPLLTPHIDSVELLLKMKSELINLSNKKDSILEELN